MVGYYRQYILSYHSTDSVLADRKMEKSRHGTRKSRMAFEELNKHLSSAPVLDYPNPSQPYILETDVSGCGVGAGLWQVQDGTKKVLAFCSKTLAPGERNYCVV